MKQEQIQPLGHHNQCAEIMRQDQNAICNLMQRPVSALIVFQSEKQHQHGQDRRHDIQGINAYLLGKIYMGIGQGYERQRRQTRQRTKSDTAQHIKQQHGGGANAYGQDARRNHGMVCPF